MPSVPHHHRDAHDSVAGARSRKARTEADPRWPRARQAWLYFRRALRLRCPECGVSPVFVPWYRTRSLRDWFTPLDGCPRCREELRRAREVLGLLDGTFREEGSLTRLGDALRQEVARRPAARRLTFARRLTALAALLLVSLGMGLWLEPGPDVPPAPALLEVTPAPALGRGCRSRGRRDRIPVVRSSSAATGSKSLRRSRTCRTAWPSSRRSGRSRAST